MGDRCTGHCCRAFTLTVHGKQLDLRGVKEVAARNPDVVHEQVVDMLIPLGRHTRNPRGRFGVAGHGIDARPVPWFTCRHHDDTTGDCRIYDERPALCRDHNPERCGYLDCSDSRAHESRAKNARPSIVSLVAIASFNKRSPHKKEPLMYADKQGSSTPRESTIAATLAEMLDRRRTPLKIAAFKARHQDNAILLSIDGALFQVTVELLGERPAHHALLADEEHEDNKGEPAPMSTQRAEPLGVQVDIEGEAAARGAWPK